MHLSTNQRRPVFVVEELRSHAESFQRGGRLQETYRVRHGEKVYSVMKYESGVHRVQRVPKTETGHSRLNHIVAALPEADETSTSRLSRGPAHRHAGHVASGPRLGRVNTTYSAVRITHIPSPTRWCSRRSSAPASRTAGLHADAACPLYEAELEKQQAEQGAERLSQIGHGNRLRRPHAPPTSRRTASRTTASASTPRGLRLLTSSAGRPRSMPCR